MDVTKSVSQQKLTRFTDKKILNIASQTEPDKSVQQVQAVGLSAIKRFMSAALIFPDYSRLFRVTQRESNQ